MQGLCSTSNVALYPVAPGELRKIAGFPGAVHVDYAAAAQVRVRRVNTDILTAMPATHTLAAGRRRNFNPQSVQFALADVIRSVRVPVDIRTGCNEYEVQHLLSLIHI